MPQIAAVPHELLPRGQRQRLVLRLLRQSADGPLRRMLVKLHPAEIGQIVPLLPPPEQQRLLELLIDLKLASATLRELDTESQRRLLAEVPDEGLAGILARLSLDDAADVLAEVDEERHEAIFERLPRSFGLRLRNLMRYGEATAGGIMNPDVVSFPEELTVGETLERLRRLAGERRLFYLYIVDGDRHLNGIVNLWQLITAAADQPLRAVMSTDLVRARVDTPQEEVARTVSLYDLLMVPVVDADGRLVGAITVDDVLDVIEEEATEDLYHLANLDTQESLATPTPRVVRLRLPWVMVNLMTALLAASVVRAFDGTISRYVVLAAFMPVVAGMGGNTGTQTLTIMVRALALGEMDFRRTLGVVGKQLLVGVLNGVAAGLVLAGVAYLFERNLVLSGVLCFAMIVNLAVGGIMGAAVPLLLRRLRLDPALGSSIFVTTATDVLGFAVFLGTASQLLHYL